jgi:hypothetical protein
MAHVQKRRVCHLVDRQPDGRKTLHIMSHPHRAGVLLGEHCSLGVHVHSGF